MNVFTNILRTSGENEDCYLGETVDPLLHDFFNLLNNNTKLRA